LREEVANLEAQLEAAKKKAPPPEVEAPPPQEREKREQEELEAQLKSVARQLQLRTDALLQQSPG